MTCTVGTILIAPRSLWDQFLTEIIASTLYVENWLLGSNSVDYSASGNASSPVQHFWTLSVEEQFYIVLPLVLIGVLLVARWRAWSVRRAALLTIAAVTVASFGWSVWMTYWAANPAYFSTLTRVWEFGVGALIVAVPTLIGVRSRTVVTAVGFVAILLAVWFYSAATPFPSYTAALPVLGTAAVIWAGMGTFGARIGAFAPVAFLGKISYAVYLWHWPPIVFVPLLTGHPLTLSEKALIFASAIVLGWLSTTQWEDRVRFSPRLLGKATPRVVAAWLAPAMVITIAIPAVALYANAQESAASGSDRP